MTRKVTQDEIGMGLFADRAFRWYMNRMHKQVGNVVAGAMVVAESAKPVSKAAYCMVPTAVIRKLQRDVKKLQQEIEADKSVKSVDETNQ